MTTSTDSGQETQAEHAAQTVMLRSDGEPTITVTEHGPYLIEGLISVRQTDGTVLRASGPCYLCRCGGSKSKPFCDATHGLKGFDGAETADHDLIQARRDDYPRADGLVVHETHEAATVTPIVDGPYRVRGNVTVVGADGQPYEARERQSLCRCGQSRNKPFCDGSHWYAGFRDPLPPELEPVYPSLYAWAGGMDALQELTRRFYSDLLDEPDPILEPVFRGMDPQHPLHVAAWLAETFGGPNTYTIEHGGYHHMVKRHQGLQLTEQQRHRWITRMALTADLVGLPDDPDFRAAFVAYLEWGTRIAVFNSQPGIAVIEHAPVPQWSWGEAPPFVPFPWDDPDAAEQGRARLAAGSDPTPGGPDRD